MGGDASVQLVLGIVQIVVTVAMGFLIFALNGTRTESRGLRQDLGAFRELVVERLARLEERTDIRRETPRRQLADLGEG